MKSNAKLRISNDELRFSFGIWHSAFGIAILLFLLASGPALAVEVQPSRLELTISAEEPTPGDLIISNHGPKAVNVQVSAGAYRFLQTTSRLPSAQEWFHFDPAAFTLGANASTKVTYEIQPPNNILQDTAGEYVAAILVDEMPSSASSTDDRQTKITIVPRLALPVYLRIRGRELVDVVISDVKLKKADPNIPSGLLRVETALLNRGSVHVRPSGTLAIFDAQGNMISTRAMGKALPLLPAATLQIPTLIPSPAPGRYRMVVTVETQPTKLLQKEVPFEVAGNGDLL